MGARCPRRCGADPDAGPSVLAVWRPDRRPALGGRRPSRAVRPRVGLRARVAVAGPSGPACVVPATTSRSSRQPTTCSSPAASASRRSCRCWPRRRLAGASWRLVYGGRTRESMAFADALITRYPGQVELVPQDTHGLIDLDALLGKPSRGHLGLLLRAVTPARCGERPDGRLAHGLAAPRTVHGRHRPRRRASLPSSQGPPSRWSCRQSAKVVTVGPDESILEAVEREGISVLFSCREGNCGTCETAVLGGVSRASRRGAHGRRARGERRHDDLRVTGGLPASGPGSLTG